MATAPHSLFFDRWNPYRKRDVCLPLLDDATFKALVGKSECEFVDPDLFMTGCLDAPDEIPLGGTSLISTIAGFEREEYLRVSREVMHLPLVQRQRGTAQMAKILKKLLADAEAAD